MYIFKVKVTKRKLSEEECCEIYEQKVKFIRYIVIGQYQQQ